MTSALDGVGVQRHAPAAFTPGKEPVPIVQEAGWAPRAGLDRCRKSCHHWNLISVPSSPWRVAILTTLSRPPNIMGPPSYMRSVNDQNIVMWLIPVQGAIFI